MRLHRSDLGCWQDKTNRTIAGGIRLTSNSSSILEDCYQYTVLNNWTIFGVGFRKHCFTAASANDTYQKFGKSDKCVHGIGGNRALSVYRISCGGLVLIYHFF